MRGLAPLVILTVFCTCAVYFDLRFARIPNALNAVGLLFGPIARFATGGTSSLRESLAGALLGLVIMLGPFLLRMVGAGDVKFLAAAGSIVGWRLLPASFLAGAALGGAVGLVLLLRRDRGLAGLRRRLVLLDAAGLRGGGASPRTFGSGLADFAMPYAVPLSIGLIAVCAVRRFS